MSFESAQSDWENMPDDIDDIVDNYDDYEPDPDEQYDLEKDGGI